MNDFLNKTFKWTYKELFETTFAALITAFAINVFIVPNNLYSSGFLGLSQLIRTFLFNILNIKSTFDISGFISLIINIPLFIIAYKHTNKVFCFRTIYTVIILTLFLSIIPVPNTPVLDSLSTMVLIGGLITGAGSGIILSNSSTTGGTELLGILVSIKNKNISVGKFTLIFNICLFSVLGLLYGYVTMIYSVLFILIQSYIVDKLHKQNICTEVMIFTKEKPSKIIDFSRKVLKRDSTYFDASGGYLFSKTYITIIVCTEYELEILEENIDELDPNAFLIKLDGVNVKGNFEKNLTK